MSEIKNNRLSHSAVTKYLTCPKEYEYHYIKRLRPTGTSAALKFGDAVDQGLNFLLTEKNRAKAYETFKKAWKAGTIDTDVVEEFCGNEKLQFSSSDLDDGILTPADWEYFSKKTSNCATTSLERIIYKRKEEGRKSLDTIERYVINVATWICLRRKGLMMLDAYNERIIPRINKVLAVQEQISLTNEEGDSITGFVDLVAEWEDGTVVVFDNKTSSIDYDKWSVRSSPQLTLYYSALRKKYNATKCGYIVLHKGIKKDVKKVCKSCKFDGGVTKYKTCNKEMEWGRCNGEWITTTNRHVGIQIIIDIIPERTETIVMENYKAVNTAIHNGVFPRNFDSCNRPWGLCPYIKKCWHNKDDGLSYVPESLEKVLKGKKGN